MQIFSLRTYTALVRQYFPMVSDFTINKNSDHQRVENRLNNRSIKCPDMKFPNQVAFGLHPSVALGFEFAKYCYIINERTDMLNEMEFRRYA